MEIEKTLEAFEKIFNEKIDTFEHHIQKLNKIIEEKDDKVISLDNKLKEMVKKFESLEKETKEENGKEKEINKKIKELENAIKKQSKTTPELLTCNECNFTTTSKIGLKTHTKRKHTNLKLDKYPKSCEFDFCESELNNEKEMDLHLKEHSYKLPEELKYKCEDCDYWGPNFLTMQVHTGRSHSEHFDCGLCDFKAKTLDNLEIHIKTCKVYECTDCYFRVKKISQIKAHMNSKHEN